jgi:hypothetical protein
VNMALRVSSYVWIWLACFFVTYPQGRAATPLKKFPLKLPDGLEKSPVLVLDLDGDGKLELALASRKKLYALEADGSAMSGFPISLEEHGFLATALSGGLLKLPSGPRAAIALGTESGKLLVIGAEGKPLAGFPLQLDAQLAGPVSFADLDGDGGNELIAASSAGKIWVVRADGRPLSGYPAGCLCEPTTAVTVSHLRPGEARQLIFGDASGALHLWEGPGRERAGFPFRGGFAVLSQPVLGDLNDDGAFEIVYGSEDYKIYAVDAGAKALPGFPVSTGYRIYSTPALADLDGDGIVEIIVTSGDGNLYVFDGRGGTRAGFPVKIGNRLQSSPAAADVDLDGRAEIAATSDDGRLWLLGPDGKKYAGFPLQPAQGAGLGPTLADLGADRSVEIIAAFRDGTVAAYSMLRKGKARGELAWPAEGRDAARSGRVYPNPARYTELAIEPSTPSTTDTLKLNYRHFDLDGEAEPATIIRWFRDGKEVKELQGQREVPPQHTRKHQKWNFTLQAGEKEAVFTGPQVEIVNTPPGAPQIVIEPGEPTCQSELQLKVTTPAADPDGDKISYRVSWLKDRQPQAKLSDWKVKGLKKGERWTAVVIPSDGEAEGPPARTQVMVKNTPPGAPVIQLEPASPRVTDRVKAVIKRPSFDADGDRITYRAQWQADENRLNVPAESLEIPASLAAKHQKLAVSVTPWDGEQNGASTSAEVRIVNTPPDPPQLQLSPASPRVTDELTLLITTASADPDLDLLTYRVTWFIDGKPAPQLHGFTVPCAGLKKNQTVKATVTAHDGEAEGKSTSLDTRVVNAPPRPPRLAAVNSMPRTSEELQVKELDPAADPDGDRLTLQAVWYEEAGKERRELWRGAELRSLPADKTKKHGKYLLRVTASDGEAISEPAEVWFEVKNTPPPACRLAIDPEKPLGGQQLRARVETPADADGDRVEVKLRWYRNGEALELSGGEVGAELVKKGQLWQLFGIPSDGEQNGPECRAEALVGNRPPLEPQITLRPEKPDRHTGLELVWLGPPADPDGDEVRTHWRWLVDGRPLEVLAGQAKIPGEFLHRGEKWQLELTLSDGESTLPLIRKEVVVGNSAPGKPEITILPHQPLSSDDLHCALLQPAPDLDGDRLEYRYSWFTGSSAEGAPVHQGPILPADRTKKGQSWTCQALAFDGLEAGPAAVASVTIQNAAPGPAEIALEPASPKTGEDLACRIKSEAIDPDGDRVKYLFRWFRDGVLQQFAAQTDRVPARLTSANDIWQCAVVPTDGELEGPPAESQEALVK